MATRGPYLPDTQRQTLFNIRRTIDATIRDDQSYADVWVVVDTLDHRRCTFGAAGKSYSCSMLILKRLAQNGALILRDGVRIGTHRVRLTPDGVRVTTPRLQSEPDMGEVA